MEHDNKNLKSNNENINNNNVYNITYEYNEIEKSKIELEKNLYLRIIKLGDRDYIDIRKYFSGRPTKKGIRFSLDTFRLFKDKILNLV
jgi:hypothetical protein